MKKYIYLLIFLTPVLVKAAPGEILKIEIDGDINPMSAKFIIDNVERAEKGEFEALLIEMDTPGGLLSATQDIVKTILEADIPVINFSRQRSQLTSTSPSREKWRENTPGFFSRITSACTLPLSGSVCSKDEKNVLSSSKEKS